MRRKTYVAGHTGLVGGALVRRLSKGEDFEIVTRGRGELDLTDRRAVDRFFDTERPDWVFLAAARVGGIHANQTYPAEFILDNLKIECNVLESAFEHKVEKLMFFGSSCIYPRMAPQPLREESLLGGPLEKTNEGYALAKISGIKLCGALNREYGTNFLCVMPPNLYGPNDNYHPENGHVLPMLIQRFHGAKEAGDEEVVLWGSGKPKREFLHVDDLTDACLFLMERHDAADVGEFINVGSGEERSIFDLARMVAEIVGFRGRIVLDRSRPDGTPRKIMDVSRIHALGWQHSIPLREGIEATYRDFLRLLEQSECRSGDAPLLQET